MKLVADVKCYYCGFISGELVSPANQSLKSGHFHPVAGDENSVSSKGGSIRCLRCGGPVFLDDTRMVRERPAVKTLERERPGRPRRVRPAEGAELAETA